MPWLRQKPGIYSFGRDWFTLFWIPIFPLSDYSGVSSCYQKNCLNYSDEFRIKLRYEGQYHIQSYIGHGITYGSPNKYSNKFWASFTGSLFCCIGGGLLGALSGTIINSTASYLPVIKLIWMSVLFFLTGWVSGGWFCRRRAATAQQWIAYGRGDI